MVASLEKTTAADSCSMQLIKGDGTVINVGETDERENTKREIRESAEEILDKMQSILAKMDDL
jgi:hypothetical protein